MNVGEKHSVLLGKLGGGGEGKKNQERFSLQSSLVPIHCPEIGKKE